MVLAHVHGPGCGHFWWHGEWWDAPHPAACAICARRPGVFVHVHGPGCGHYFWHGGYWGYPHPADCPCGFRGGVSLGFGLGTGLRGGVRGHVGTGR